MKNLVLRRPSTTDRNYFKAAYTYQSDDPGDLSFEVGDVIIVTKEGEADDWWFGMRGAHARPPPPPPSVLTQHICDRRV